MTKQEYDRMVEAAAADLADLEAERGRTIAEQVAEVIAETIDEISMMTMGYPENRFFADDGDADDEDNFVVQMLDRWADRYTPFHREFFQAVSGR